VNWPYEPPDVHRRDPGCRAADPMAPIRERAKPKRKLPPDHLCHARRWCISPPITVPAPRPDVPNDVD
jgi:hypothetical protein